MGWLREWTSKCNLKKSFAIYLCVFLMLGIILAMFNSTLIEKYQINESEKHLKKMVKDGKEIYISIAQGSSVLRTYANRVLLVYKDFSVIIHSILFCLLGFSIYYRDKIEEPVGYICEIDRVNLGELSHGDNELIYACNKITEEMQHLQEEKIKVWNRYDTFNHMVSSMGHDIKNPLTIIKGNVEILEMTNEKSDSNRIKSEAIESIKSNLNRMERYLDRIDKLQSMEQLQINKEWISVLEFIKILKYNSEVLNSNKRIHWIIPKEDVLVNIDTYHIEEAFENVLNNAIIHAKLDIYVNIEIDDKKVVISIQDDGSGFSREALKNATNKFYSENPQSGNMGLGLNITNSILEKHSGELIIKNHSNGALVEMIINL